MKILILKFRHIGDVLLMTPLLRNLKSIYPESIIDVAVNSGTEEMLTNNPNISSCIVYERSDKYNRNKLLKIFKEIKFFSQFYSKQYDMVINLTEGDRGGIISKISMAKIRIGYPSKNFILKNAYTHYMSYQGEQHIVDINLEALKALNLPIRDKKVQIFWNEKDEKFIEEEVKDLKGFIHIHPVSRWSFKTISDNTMAEIIDFCMNDLKKEVIVTSGPAIKEIKQVERILSKCSSNPKNYSGNLSLKKVSALNNKADMFIGVDTAVMHISAANDIPVLAFFGPSGAKNWGPWDNNIGSTQYKKINGIQRMGIHTVMSESRVCQPCGKDGCNGSKISDCLMSFNLEEIKREVLKILRR